MLARPTVSARAVSRKATCNTEIARIPTPEVRRAAVVRASAAPNDASSTPSPSRRAVLLAVPAGALLLQSGIVTSGFIGPARAEGYKTFLGYSQAPDLYLGYGAAKDSPPLYTFEYPASWEEEAPSKTTKSTMGMDGLVLHPKTRKEQAYVVALGGKDYRDSVLKDARTSLIAIAGGDPDLRQAVTDGEVKQVERTINGTPMYMYEITSDRRTYLSTIGKKGDTIFALVVTAPHNAFEQDAADLRHIQDTFKLL